MSSSRTLRRLALALALSLVGGGLLAAPADAKVRTKTFPATVKFLHGKNPNNDKNCSAVGFAEFTRNLGSISASAKWKVRTQRGGIQNRSETYTGPLFDDVYLSLLVYEAPQTAHWLLVASGAQAGGDGECADEEAKLRQAVFGKVTVTLTYEDDEDKVCVRWRDVQAQADAKHRQGLKTLDALEPGPLKDRYAVFVSSLKSRLERAKALRKEACALAF